MIETIEMSDEDKWSSVPVKLSTRYRLALYKKPKKHRKKNQEIMETVDDLINRVLDFYDEHGREE